MKVLFVVTAFYPEQAIGSVRVTKFAKYLQRQGVEVSVISLTPAPWALRDEGLYFEGLENMKWTTIDQSSFFKRLFYRARIATVGNSSAVGFVKPTETKKSLKGMIKSKAQFVYTLIKAMDWVFQVKRHARRNMKDESYSLVFSSYPSFSSPFAALKLARLGFARNVMIDFRDPVSYGTNSRFSIPHFFERWMLSKVQLVSFVSDGIRKKVWGNEYRKPPYVVINNGYDPEDGAMIEASARVGGDRRILRFAYVGSLYGGKRKLQPFFKAAELALVQSGLEKGVLELHYAGGEGDMVSQQAKQYGFAGCIVDHGRISRNESLSLQKSVDVCLVATWNSKEDKGIITGKIFECYMLRKPVLAIVAGSLPESELGRIIRETEAGICYEEAKPEDFPLLVSWIQNAINQKNILGGLSQNYNENVENFTFSSLASDLKDAMELLDHCLASKRL